MTLYLEGHSFRYELENVARLFFSGVNVENGRPLDDGRDFVHAVRDASRLSCDFRVGGKTAEMSCEVPTGEDAPGGKNLPDGKDTGKDVNPLDFSGEGKCPVNDNVYFGAAGAVQDPYAADVERDNAGGVHRLEDTNFEQNNASVERNNEGGAQSAESPNIERDNAGVAGSQGTTSTEDDATGATKKPHETPDAEKRCELALAKLMYDGLCELTGKRPAWGVITGIRPAKFAETLMQGGLTPGETVSLLETEYRVSKSKAELCVETARHSERTAELTGKNSYSLYVSIPFCPSRCSYCSFVSKTVGRDRSMLNDYLGKLCDELEASAAIANELGLKLESAYIGGGTPTVLSAEQLERLTGVMNKLFGARSCREFSVEAGRPDTIDRDKLAVLKAAGVTRLSINPQTGNNNVLSLAGRAHTKEDVERCFADARSLGHNNINADLIAGLPGDDVDSFADSVRWIESLDPENITVHALTLKRASFLTEEGIRVAQGASKMVDYAYSFLTQKGYSPYYMYKQKGTVESLENTGYSKNGFDCLYNIYIMDELHTIVACGAGAVTKLKDPNSSRIERIFNYKYPAEYINGFGEMLRRKGGLRAFYEGVF